MSCGLLAFDAAHFLLVALRHGCGGNNRHRDGDPTWIPLSLRSTTMLCMFFSCPFHTQGAPPPSPQHAPSFRLGLSSGPGAFAASSFSGQALDSLSRAHRALCTITSDATWWAKGRVGHGFCLCWRYFKVAIPRGWVI